MAEAADIEAEGRAREARAREYHREVDDGSDWDLLGEPERDCYRQAADRLHARWCGALAAGRDEAVRKVEKAELRATRANARADVADRSRRLMRARAEGAEEARDAARRRTGFLDREVARLRSELAEAQAASGPGGPEAG